VGGLDGGIGGGGGGAGRQWVRFAPGSHASGLRDGAAGRLERGLGVARGGSLHEGDVIAAHEAGRGLRSVRGKDYFGLLKGAPCDQQMYLTMASVADQLGVECKHCHAPHPTDPKKEEYPVMTPKKEIANWMSMHLMSAIKPADGTPMKCKSCHIDDKGKPLLKILGNPRDPGKAQEWMSLVMVNKFVTRSTGEKLKCKSCHAGNYTTPQWKAKVILKSEQIPAHEVGGGTVR
jgi:hypothetical protein